MNDPAATELSSINIVRDLSFFSEFVDFLISTPAATSRSTEDLIVRHVKLWGIRTDFAGWTPPEDVRIIGPELREHLMSRGLNSRQRAVCDAIVQTAAEMKLTDDEVAIYGQEAITPFAKMMRGRFVRYIGSEYCRNREDEKLLFPIRHADACNLEFPDDSFHIVTSNEVFEHVPDLDAALREACRVLKPGGRFIGTFPFNFSEDEGNRFASLIDGELVHHSEPVYHGNPMDPDGGSLVFEIPGWDIVDRARRAGFSRPRMRFVCQQDKGIVCSHPDDLFNVKGVLMAYFQK